MNTTITPLREPAATLPGPDRPARRTGSVLALARFEARELLLQIPVLVFTALYVGVVAVGLMRQEGMDDFPVLHRVDRETQTAPLLLAIALLVCANAAALRSRKHGTVQQFDVLAMEPWRRTLAHLLSVVPFTALTAVVVAAEFTREALKPGAIGHGSLGELAVGPLSVLLAGITGVLLARVVPSSFAPILFVVAVYVLIVTASAAAGSDDAWVSRLSAIPVSDIAGGDDPVPSGLLGRPAAWHALYLAGLCALLSCAALLFSGGRTRAVRAATALALAATTAGVIGQVPRDTEALEAARKTASTTPQKVQSCTTYGRSTYCAFPEWNGVRDDWARVVDRVQSAAGGTAAETRLTVRQRVDTSGGIEVDSSLAPSPTPAEVTVGTRWGGNRVPEFAVGVATVLVAGSEDAAQDFCDARPVTIMWLVLGTDPTPLSTFTKLRLDDTTIGSGHVLAPTNGLSLTAQQTAVVRELLTRPRAQVSTQVKTHWSELTSSKTSTAEAARLLGVAAPEGADSCEE